MQYVKAAHRGPTCEKIVIFNMFNDDWNIDHRRWSKKMPFLGGPTFKKIIILFSSPNYKVFGCLSRAPWPCGFIHRYKLGRSVVQISAQAYIFWMWWLKNGPIANKRRTKHADWRRDHRMIRNLDPYSLNQYKPSSLNIVAYFISPSRLVIDLWYFV